MPHRVAYPPELYEIGITTLSFKPYRIIYTIIEETQQVFVEVIIDGRRDIEPIMMEFFTKNN